MVSSMRTEGAEESERAPQRPPAAPDPAALEALVGPARSGHRPSAERLLAALLPRVRNLVRYLVRGDRDVDDISQEALTLVFRRLETYSGQGAFLSWVDRVTARATFASRRRERALREVYPEEAEQLAGADVEPPSGPEAYVARRRLVLLLDTIPDEQRHALVMHHVLGWTVPEIGAELRISEETVRSRLRLGRTRLRARMEGEA
jgi:RNA polymerase sigma-70 factor (ECF subfamily)